MVQKTGLGMAASFATNNRIRTLDCIKSLNWSQERLQKNYKLYDGFCSEK